LILTVLKNLFSRPVTRRYPAEAIREPCPDYRGAIVFDVNKCVLCNACARVCPALAITIKRTERQIIFDSLRCIYCRRCLESCPKDAISQDVHYAKPRTGRHNMAMNVPVPPKPSPKPAV